MCRAIENHKGIISSWIVVIFVAMSPFAQAQSSSPVFTKDILPILQEHCQGCHRPGQIAPMSLLTYKEVRPWAKSISKEVSNRNMPPFHAESPLGYFEDDPRLTDEQVNSIVQWVADGAPQGNPKLAPPPLEWPGEYWHIGKPDQIFEFTDYTINHELRDGDFALLFSDYVFPEDTWVKAIEFKPSDYSLVHHAGVLTVDDRYKVPENNILLNTTEEGTGQVQKKNVKLLKQNFMFTWLPGLDVSYRGDGQGYLIKKGDRLVLQVHYATVDEATNCDIQVGIKFVHGEINFEHKAIGMIMNKMKIPPHDPSYVIKRVVAFPQDSEIQAFLVHMHLRGKSTKFVFTYPDGRVETAFHVPKYNFDWQRTYHLKEPYTVPKGTQVEIIAEWDNSAGNPLNPDPSLEIGWGWKTNDEMYGGSIYHTVKLDEPIMVYRGRELK